MRISHTNIIATALSVLFLAVIFSTLEEEHYHFPIVLMSAFIILTVALWLGGDIKEKMNNKRPLFYGLAIAFLYIFLLETLGFYVSSFLVFLSIIVLYKDKNERVWHQIARKIIFVSVSTSVLFLLFSVLLQVRVPTIW